MSDTVQPHIIVWGINYAPELTGIAPYNKIICDYLAQAGLSVEMVSSFAYYPAWKKAAADKSQLYRLDLVDGIPVHRCWHYVPAKVTTLRRMLHEASFIATSFFRLLTLPSPALYLVISPPLLSGVAASLLSWMKGAGYVFHVQDLQPDAAVGLGMVESGWMVRVLYRLEAIAYRQAQAVSGISQGMIAAFRSKGVPAEKLIYFPNPVALEPETPGGVEKGGFRRAHGISETDFLVVYSGNLGVKQGIEIAVDAAQQLVGSQIQFVICGEGARREELASRLRELALDHVQLLPLLPRTEYYQMLKDADVCLITQQKGSGRAFFPSKLLATLALGKPVITVADEESELNRAVQEGEFGVNVLPGEPAALAQELTTLAASPHRLVALGEAGRRFVEQFEQSKVLGDFAEKLRRLSR